MAVQYKSMLLIALLVIASANAHTGDELTEMLHAGLVDIERETIDGAVTLESGSIPNWLSGNFIRHTCGVLGETGHRNKTLPNYITHLFDCFEIGSKYRFDNGQVTFTIRQYDTTANDIYSYYGRDMNASSVFVGGTFSKIRLPEALPSPNHVTRGRLFNHTTAVAFENAEQKKLWQANMSTPTKGKVSTMPSVSWWQIGNDAIAMTEYPIGVVVDTEQVAHKGYMQFNDDNLGVPQTRQYSFANNPAHENTDADGALWSTVSVVKFETPTHLKIWRVVYKVGADKVRHVVGTYHYADSDLTKCTDGNPYPEFGARFGYMHSFAMTENYIILPEAAYMHDPCLYTHYDPYKPFFTQGYRYESNGFSRLLVMRKSDGVFVGDIHAPPFFPTHQFGAYEEGSIIHMDMLTYNDSSIYDKHTYVDYLLSENVYTTNVTRISINMTDHTARMRNLRAPGKTPEAMEMSNINYAYYGKKYTYGYMIRNFDRRDQNAITKLNVDTGVETEYVFPEGMYAQEPQFIPKPGAKMEDDGVIISQGVDGRKRKGFMVVVDAKTMKLIAHVTAPDIATFGLHNRFFPLKSAVKIPVG